MAVQSVNQSGLTRSCFLQDEDDILNWGVPNRIDFIAASFVRKGIDLVNIRKLLGKHAKSIHIISKVGFYAAGLGPVSVSDRLASRSGIRAG
jgi:pyruvate kinase